LYAVGGTRGYNGGPSPRKNSNRTSPTEDRVPALASDAATVKVVLAGIGVLLLCVEVRGYCCIRRGMDRQRFNGHSVQA
jgi:hypothetical protein